MHKQSFVVVLAAIAMWSTLGLAENVSKDLKKAVERSTLDQSGTAPFHLKAALAPAPDRDTGSGRTGEIEIWWASPTQWKRELRSPEFHQIEIVDGSHNWQKNEGDYFPEWLRQAAIELIQPVQERDHFLEHAKNEEVRHLGSTTSMNWTKASGTAGTPNVMRSWFALDNNTGLLLYAGGFGWDGEFKDYKNFHDRIVAQTVNVGTPQLTAKITTLEDLGQVPAGFFDTSAAGGDAQPLHTVLIDETSLRANLLPMEPPVWPPVSDGPLEGNVTSEIVVDRTGKVREVGSVMSENSPMDQTGKLAATTMRFKPFLLNGVPVQATSQVTIHFKTVRPAGTETFDSARVYFERGRHAGFAAAGTGSPYLLHAEFMANSAAGTPEKGRYEDTWLSDAQWRREAWFAKSHYVRSRNGKKTYQFAEGPETFLLQVLMRAMEPIPAIDTFTESDWKIKRDPVDHVQTLRVLAGYESPEGKLDPEQARAYWFDDAGLLWKTYFKGIETRRSDFKEFAGVKIAHQIDVQGGGLAMSISVTDVAAAGTVPSQSFEVPKHEWTRAFTDEVR